MMDWRENLFWGIGNICTRTGRNTRDFHHDFENQFAYISPFDIIFSPSTSIELPPSRQLSKKHKNGSKSQKWPMHTVFFILKLKKEIFHIIDSQPSSGRRERKGEGGVNRFQPPHPPPDLKSIKSIKSIESIKSIALSEFRTPRVIILWLIGVKI